MTDAERRDNKITISKKTLILSAVIVVSLSVFLVVSGPLSSSLLLSPIKVRAQQQPTSHPSSQPSSRPQQPTSQPQQPSSQPSSKTQQPSSNSPSSSLGPITGSSSTTTTQTSPSSEEASVSTQAKSNDVCKATSDSGQCKKFSNSPDLCTCKTTTPFKYCTNFASDPKNCNGCGIICSKDFGSDPNVINTCVNGQCDFKCKPGYNKCGNQCIIETDRNNCFGCGIKCAPDQICDVNTRSCAPDLPCPPTLTDCGFNPDGTRICKAGVSLCNGQCIAINDNTNCGGTSSSCGNDCTDTSTYPSGSTCVLVGGTTYMCKDQLNCIGNSCNGNANECGIPSGCVSCDRCVNIQPFP